MFADSQGGGHRAALFYTLIEPAKLNGVHPHACLTHAFQKLPSPRFADFDALMPRHFDVSSTTDAWLEMKGVEIAQQWSC